MLLGLENISYTNKHNYTRVYSVELSTFTVSTTEPFRHPSNSPLMKMNCYNALLLFFKKYLPNVDYYPLQATF